LRHGPVPASGKAVSGKAVPCASPDENEFATVEGARCNRPRKQVGTFTPGRDADIVLLKADRLDLWPLNNMRPGAVVNLMNPSNVVIPFIAGKARNWRGDLVGVDVPRVLVAEARDAVVRRSASSSTRWADG